MLSIGKLSADQATYYLDQAETRVDVVESVGGGVEEYYVGGREARGEWLGGGAADLRLAGGVDGDALRLVVEPRHVVQLVEASDRGLVVEGAVWSAMVVGP